MKVFYRRDKVYAKAESLQDIQMLLGMKGATIARTEVDIPTVKKPGGAWAIKPKLDCPKCGKGYKSLKMHERMKHQLQGV